MHSELRRPDPEEQPLPPAGSTEAASAHPYQARGIVYSTYGNHAVSGHAWGFWYLRTSKRVWFRVDRGAVKGLQPVFTYNGRVILHRSELARGPAQSSQGSGPPVVWGHYLGSDWAEGPKNTQLSLLIWTRWSWLHPEACGQPGRFAVSFSRPAPAP
ncbi:hypothetical protein [Cyanobium sp. NS01]|uniref:hypothetical protein n=1 Tax=Cyanobium sp. NS01 TaxID=261284 RepID=UPI001645259F|nr:hypothetical protein [Cyanobium sp. NS01]QNI70650.1 hypothetical protein CyaNS01_01518 [Cyanobium sp. NS01]